MTESFVSMQIPFVILHHALTLKGGTFSCLLKR